MFLRRAIYVTTLVVRVLLFLSESGISGRGIEALKKDPKILSVGVRGSRSDHQSGRDNFSCATVPADSPVLIGQNLRNAVFRREIRSAGTRGG